MDGVGDQTAGEWEEWTGRAFHVRRRLSDEEQKPIGPAVDIRGTREAINRVMAVSIVNPHIPFEMMIAEMYGDGES